jgi:hypothetical protein
MTRLALKEWALAAEAIARGDMLVTLRKGGIHEKEFLVAGTRFWLAPTYEHQTRSQTKHHWHGELRRSQQAQPARGLHVRCLCEVHAAHAITDAETVDALSPFHVWTAEYAAERLGWRPTKPLWALVVRAYALVDPVEIPWREAYDGCRSWIELEDEVPQDGLLPALSDTAFALHAARVEQALSSVGAHAAV